MISRSSEGGGSLPIVDYIGFMPIDLGAVNFDALPLPDISSDTGSPVLAFGVTALQCLRWRWQAAVADHFLCQLDRTLFAVGGAAQVRDMGQTTPLRVLDAPLLAFLGPLHIGPQRVVDEDLGDEAGACAILRRRRA
jgi:hypothetical protein